VRSSDKSVVAVPPRALGKFERRRAATEAGLGRRGHGEATRRSRYHRISRERSRTSRYRRRGRQCVLEHIGRRCASTLFKDSRFSRVGARTLRGQAMSRARATRTSLSDPSPRFVPRLGEGTLASWIPDRRSTRERCLPARRGVKASSQRNFPNGSTTHYSPWVTGPTVMACQLLLPTRRGITPVCVRTRRFTGRAARRVRRVSRYRRTATRACVLPSLLRLANTLDVFEDSRDGIPRRESPHSARGSSRARGDTWVQRARSARAARFVGKRAEHVRGSEGPGRHRATVRYRRTATSGCLSRLSFVSLHPRRIRGFNGRNTAARASPLRERVFPGARRFLGVASRERASRSVRGEAQHAPLRHGAVRQGGPH
jgi:hypothetical protein